MVAIVWSPDQLKSIRSINYLANNESISPQLRRKVAYKGFRGYWSQWWQLFGHLTNWNQSIDWSINNLANNDSILSQWVCPKMAGLLHLHIRVFEDADHNGDIFWYNYLIINISIDQSIIWPIISQCCLAIYASKTRNYRFISFLNTKPSQCRIQRIFTPKAAWEGQRPKACATRNIARTRLGTTSKCARNKTTKGNIFM